jgi:hypothetical protein
VYDGATLIGSTTVSATGATTVSLPAYKHKGVHTLTVRYLGTQLFAASSTATSFTVSNK